MHSHGSLGREAASPDLFSRDAYCHVGNGEWDDVGFQSLTERIDTASAGGKLIFHVIGALAEFERGMILERTNAGLDAAHDESHCRAERT
jgi:hypothetical protein